MDDWVSSANEETRRLQWEEAGLSEKGFILLSKALEPKNWPKIPRRIYAVTRPISTFLVSVVFAVAATTGLTICAAIWLVSRIVRGGRDASRAVVSSFKELWGEDKRNG